MLTSNEQLPKNAMALRIFSVIVERPRAFTLLSIIVMAALLSFLPGLTKDTRGDAFIAPDNPALLYREKVKQQFGLADPLVIALIHENPNGVYQTSALQLIDHLSNEVSEIANVDPERIMSLATENNISGTDEGLDVDPFFEPYPSEKADGLRIKKAIEDFPLYQGKLVARDGQATVIVVEMLDENLAEQTYHDINNLLQDIQTPEGVSLHLAGEGAVAGYLGSYVDSDASRLNPLAGLIITLIIGIAFRRLAPALLANVIIAASVLITLSMMAASSTPFYVITNALPVILIGISVADAIHIFSHYYELQSRQPETDRVLLVKHSMEEMWRPITLTTLTTMAGFFGLYFASGMPPFKYMGLFTALGVAIAWLFSMVFLPAAMAWSKPKVSQRFIQLQSNSDKDLFASLMTALGRTSLTHAKTVLTAGAILIVVGVFSASQLIVDEDRIKTFHPSEPIYKADRLINKHLDGSNNLDIVIETPAVEDLFKIKNLKKMEALQTYALSLPTVNNATSIVDYLKQMNRVLNNGNPADYRLPSDSHSVAQYFLLYSASSDPTDFEEEVDYDYQIANIRLNINSAAFTDNRPVIEALEAYIADHFNDDDIQATLSGRVTLNHHWIKDIGTSHFASLGVAIVLVWLVSSILFGSSLAGVFSVLPVASSILLIYSAMAAMDIRLGIGTSMFASVAIGLGVDFAIHTLDRIRQQFTLLSRRQQSVNDAEINARILAIFPTTGRALLFNFLAIACGFGVLISSKVVPLNNFGTIVALAVTTSFLASVTLLPALIKVFKPRFVLGDLQWVSNQPTLEATTPAGNRLLSLAPLATAALLGPLLFSASNVEAESSELPSGEWIVNQVNSMDDGHQVTRKLHMTLTDRRGKKRLRNTIGYRKYFGDDKRTVLFYLSPTNVKDTGFLTYDYPAEKSSEDDQWLYLPALRKVRRISASDRGDYFLGTDFTYEDIKKEGKLDTNDYQYVTQDQQQLHQRNTYRMIATPVSDKVAKELGYGKVELWIDQQSWLVVKANYWDLRNNPLKTLIADDVRQVNGIWTRHKMTMSNHKTGHTSQFVFSDVDYQSAVKDSVFTKRSLSRGG
ncbi:MAG: outer membrane lipoprotein-sorting protein [Cellvibrionaceae bacterium]